MKPKREWVDIEFILEEAIDEYPAHKIFRYTKGCFAHFVRMEHQKEVSEKLVGWLRRSYFLINKT